MAPICNVLGITYKRPRRPQRERFLTRSHRILVSQLQVLYR